MDNDWADFRLLMFMLKVLQHRSVREAAEELHTTSSNISRAAKKFYEQSGMRLYTLTKDNRIEPTEEGLAFYVLHRASQEICDWRRLATFKAFLMDEAWLFMRNRIIRDYILQAEKTWRKHKAAMILATQSVNELEESGLLNIVVESCPTKIFLANPEMDRALYAEKFRLNPMVCDLIAGLYPPGQMVICQPNFTKKAHLNVDSVTHWMASNDPKANLKRREFFDRYGIADGLRELANQFPFEASRLNNLRIPTRQGAVAA